MACDPFLHLFISDCFKSLKNIICIKTAQNSAIFPTAISQPLAIYKQGQEDTATLKIFCTPWTAPKRANKPSIDPIRVDFIVDLCEMPSIDWRTTPASTSKPTLKAYFSSHCIIVLRISPPGLEHDQRLAPPYPLIQRAYEQRHALPTRILTAFSSPMPLVSSSRLRRAS